MLRIVRNIVEPDPFDNVLEQIQEGEVCAAHVPLAIDEGFHLIPYPQQSMMYWQSDQRAVYNPVRVEVPTDDLPTPL